MLYVHQHSIHTGNPVLMSVEFKLSMLLNTPMVINDKQIYKRFV
jgi:hypothetical protein